MGAALVGAAEAAIYLPAPSRASRLPPLLQPLLSPLPRARHIQFRPQLVRQQRELRLLTMMSLARARS